MSAMVKVKKQSSILDFFRNKAEPNSKTTDIVSEKSCQSESTNETSIKQPNELHSNGKTQVIIKEIPLIDVNFVENNLFEVTMEECDDNDSSMICDVTNGSLSGSDAALINFRIVLQAILSDVHFGDLFSEDDSTVIQEFTCLSGPVQLLFLKLYMRKRSWIQKSNIKYPDVDPSGNHDKSLVELVKHGFLVDSSSFENIEEALGIMNCGQLKEFLKTYMGFDSSTYKFHNKKYLIARFLEYARSTKSAFVKEQTCNNEPVKTIEDNVLNRLQVKFSNDCFKINFLKSSVFDRIFLLYFNPTFLLDDFEQWHRTVLTDYRLSDNYPICDTNKAQFIYFMHYEFDEFFNAFDLVCRILNEINEKKFKHIVDRYMLEARSGFSSCYRKWHEKDEHLSVHLRPLTATGMYLRAIHECLAALEKVKKYQDYVDIAQNELLSQTIYGTNYRAHWYARAASISEFHLKNLNLAKSICHTGLQDCSVRKGNRLELYKIVEKMKCISEFVHICPDLQSLIYQEKTIYSEFKNIENDSSRKNFYFVTLSNGDVNIMSVEDIVIRHYKLNGYPDGIHCESSIYYAFFALFLWDIIYSVEVSDSFRFYKQVAPLDLNYDSFFERRKHLIEPRLKQISKLTQAELISELISSWNTNCNKSSQFIEWKDELLEQLTEIIVCFTVEQICQILQVMAQDFRNFRKGFPDLIVWNKQTRQVKLIEVKSLRDRVSPFQIICLSYLTSLGLDVELCHVKPYTK